MGFGSAFKSAWDNASNAVKEKVAQAATTAKKVANQVVDKAQQLKQQAEDKAKFIAQQTAKSAIAAKDKVVKKIDSKITQVKEAVEQAKQNVKKLAVVAKQKFEAAKQTAKKVAEQVKQKVNQAKNAVKQKAAQFKDKVKQAFQKVKKAFSPKNIVKAAVQLCPIVKDVFNYAKSLDEIALVSKAKDFKNNSVKKTLAQGLSKAIPGLKSVKDFYDEVNPLYQAAKSAQNPLLAFAKHNVRKLNVPNILSGIALDMAVGGLVGGFDSLSKNIDRTDISKANLAGRVGFGAVKGAAKPLLSAGMAAGTGAIIGGVIGLFLGGATAIPAAALGAKIGAAFLTPLFDKPAEWVTDYFLDDKMEDKAGKLGDKAASAVKGVTQGIANFFH